MARRLLSISTILGILLLSLLLSANQNVFALTATPTAVGNIGYRTIGGKVTNASTGAAIAGATVTCSHTSYVSGTRCSGTTTTAADGSYAFPNVYVHDTDGITVSVQATGYTSQSVTKGGTYFLSTLATVNFALVASNITVTPTFTPTATNTPTPTPTVGTTGTCSPVSATITAPFTKDGAGTFCWQSTNLGSYINSWNLTSLSINGINITNSYVVSASYPAKIGGYWYVSYSAPYSWSHFEAK